LITQSDACREKYFQKPHHSKNGGFFVLEKLPAPTLSPNDKNLQTPSMGNSFDGIYRIGSHATFVAQAEDEKNYSSP